MTAPALADAVIGNRGYPERGLGFGIVTRAAQLLLIERLNDEVQVQQDRFMAADLAFQEIVGGGPGQTSLEAFDILNIIAGPHRSLLIAPASYFPNVSVMAYYVSARTSQNDHVDDLDVRLGVEVMVKSNEITESNAFDQETILHRRSERTIEAVDNVLRSDPTFLGTCLPGEGMPPRGGLTNQSDVNRKNNSEPLHYYQSGRLEYTIQRQALPAFQ